MPWRGRHLRASRGRRSAAQSQQKARETEQVARQFSADAERYYRRQPCLALGRALFCLAPSELLHHTTLVVAYCPGVAGVGGLVSGSGLLVGETRRALRILREQTEFLLKRPSPNPKAR